MKSEKYVLSHDFGYGKTEKITKLCLRNLKDLKVYLFNLLSNEFDTKVVDNKFFLLDTTLKEVKIQKILTH